MIPFMANTYARRSVGMIGAMVLLAATVQPAWAHAVLVDSVPALAGHVPAGTVAVHLHYNSRVDRARSRITLTRPDRSQMVLPISPDGAPDALESTATLVPGAYTLRWQVLATDGHITRGDVAFTVTPAP